MKRLLTLMLVLAMVVTLFTACAGQTEPEKTQGKQEQTQAGTDDKKETANLDKWGRPMVESSLPADLKFEGDTVNIFVEVGSMKWYNTEEYTDDLINDSIYDRNIKVETDLNVKLNWIESASSQAALVSEIETIVNAGTNDYDVAIGYSYFMVSGVRGMVFANLYEVPNLDLTKPWWNQRYVEEATLADQLYTITGDMILSSTYNTGCMFFNKRLADEEYSALGGSEYIYKLVLDGKWTIDAFTELVKDKYRDEDGDGNPSDGDFFGFGNWLSGPIPADSFSFGMGAFITEDNEEGLPEFVYDREHTVNVLHKMFVLFNDSEGVYYKPGTAPNFYNNGEAHTMLLNKFINGSMIFCAETLGTAQSFLDMKDDYGLLPMPKYDEAQAEYYTSSHDGYHAIVVPFGIESSDRAELVGATLEKLAEESYRTVAPNYFEVVMKYRYIRSEDDADYDLQMYDLILNGNTYNFGLIFSNTMENPSFAFRHLIGKDGNENFSSYWGAKDTAVKNKFKGLVNWFIEE